MQDTHRSEEIFGADVNICISGSPYLEGYIFENAEEIQGYVMVAKAFLQSLESPVYGLRTYMSKNEYRGLGIGSLFLKFIESKYSSSMLYLEVEAENDRAVNVYKKRL